MYIKYVYKVDRKIGFKQIKYVLSFHEINNWLN